MPSGQHHAPLLSTPQDNSAFTYAKSIKTNISRTHLKLEEDKDYVAATHDYYSLEELASFLSQYEHFPDGNVAKKYKSVALQFPDLLICDAAIIIQELQKMIKSSSADFSIKDNFAKENGNMCCKGGSGNGWSTNSSCKPGSSGDSQKLWILADTSYSACCVDEVAAQHVNADIVVHFGDACLNPVACLPSVYVFGKPHLDLNIVAEKFRNRFPLGSNRSQKIVLMADAPHTRFLNELAQNLSEYQVFSTELYLADDRNSRIIGHKPQSCHSQDLKTLGRIFQKLDVSESNDAILSDYQLFHIGLPEAPRLLQLTTKFQSVSIFNNNEVTHGPYPNLTRRYRYMHMARSAGTIGILANTLSLANTKDLMNLLVKKIKNAGKKHYIFVVGKPNVAKLANFEVVDMWCVLGCDHQGIIIDQTSEYFKPIITPYELLLAIADNFTWTGKWVTDFQNVLQEIDDDSERQKEQADQTERTYESDESDQEPEFNSVTGQYSSFARPLRRLQHLRVTTREKENESMIQNDRALVQKLSGAVAFGATISTSAAYLQTREWAGLGSDRTKDLEGDGASVEEGTSGIARAYGFDIKNQDP